MLAKAKVQAVLERLAQLKDDQLDLSNERILDKLSEIAFSDGQKTRDSLRALDFLCKTRGMYPRKPEVEEEQVMVTLNIRRDQPPVTAGEQ